jgi:2-polyprenyl-3-methyl-5-hydroxy-6-metoxy-1,4-benzoquinol methylase
MQPQSVLDIGVGRGKWGVLTREYTDIWLQRKQHIVKIDGIEIFEKYRNPNWANYTNIFIGDVRTILPTLPSYDLIIFIEVLEHIDKSESLHLLDLCRSKCKVLLFSYTNSPQGTAFGNIHETHKSQWDVSDFKFPVTLLCKNDVTFLYKTRGNV